MRSWVRFSALLWDFVPSGDLFHGLHELDASVSFVRFLFYVVVEGPFTMLITDHAKPTNCVHFPINTFPDIVIKGDTKEI